MRSATIGSQLEDIKGVGEARRNELLKHFKTIKAIKLATFEELNAVVPKNTAKAVYDCFHGDEQTKLRTEDTANADDMEEKQ